MVKKLEWHRETVKTTDIKKPFNTLQSQFDNDIENDFITSVRDVGIIEPIKLINVKDCADPGLYLVDGKHRLNEIEHHQQNMIDALVSEGTMEDVYDYNVVLNTLRGKTEPYQLALLVDHLAKKFTFKELADRWHMSESYLGQLRSIVNERKVFNEWKRGNLSFHEARNIVYQVQNDKKDVNQLLKDIISGKEQLEDSNGDIDDAVDHYVDVCAVCGNPIARKQSRFLTVHKGNCSDQFFEALIELKKSQSLRNDKTKEKEVKKHA